MSVDRPRAAVVVIAVDAVDDAAGAGDPRLQILCRERLDEQLVALGDTHAGAQSVGRQRDDHRHLGELLVGRQARADLRAEGLLLSRREHERERRRARLAPRRSQRAVGGHAVRAEAELREQPRGRLRAVVAVDPGVAHSSLR